MVQRPGKINDRPGAPNLDGKVTGEARRLLAV